MKEIRQAVPATHDRAVIQSRVLMVQAAVRVIQNLKEDIARCEQRIEQLSKAHPDFALFDSLPGAGDALVPRLIAALGTQRDRFESAADIQAYTGIAPVVRQSGNTRSIHCRQAYPRFLRQTFPEWAAHSIMKSEWAREYYEQQLARGNKHHAAVRSLAFKWIRILFRCWKDGVPYDETVYRKAQKSRRSPAAPADDQVVNLEWKTVAGFLKISVAKP